MNPPIQIPMLLAVALWPQVGVAQPLFTWSGSQPIPDNNPTGVVVPFTISGETRAIASLAMTLEIAGGYNGDLYGYLSYSGGGFSVLLNRVGVGSTTPGSSAEGYADGGFAITLRDSAVGNVHFYQNSNPVFSGGQLTGDWRPDGRTESPDAPASFFDALGTAGFGSFEGLLPNGDWQLFLADVSPLGTATLTGFSVSLVPEPGVGTSLAAIALLFAATRIGRGHWAGRAAQATRAGASSSQFGPERGHSCPSGRTGSMH